MKRWCTDYGAGGVNPRENIGKEAVDRLVRFAFK